MKKRKFERVAVNLPVNFFYDNALYTGKATNLSDSGMYIGSDMCLPFQSRFDVFFSSSSKLNLLFPLQYEDAEVQVKVKRLTKTDGCYNGMGVEFLNHSDEFFVVVREFDAGVSIDSRADDAEITPDAALAPPEDVIETSEPDI